MPESKLPVSGLREVRMVRDSLRDVPPLVVPAPFSMRPYREGDEETWVAVQREAERYHDISVALFKREFGDDEALLGQRQYFLCDGDGRAVGTATAWVAQAGYGPACGRIHWVAIVPSMQGRGLAKPLVAALLSRMAELGHERAYLTTETVRLPAILLYQGLGFAPEVREEGDRAAWQELARACPAIRLPF